MGYKNINCEYSSNAHFLNHDTVTLKIMKKADTRLKISNNEIWVRDYTFLGMGLSLNLEAVNIKFKVYLNLKYINKSGVHNIQKEQTFDIDPPKL